MDSVTLNSWGRCVTVWLEPCKEPGERGQECSWRRSQGQGQWGQTYSVNKHAANVQWPLVGHALSQVLGIQGTHPGEGPWSQAAWGLAPSGFPKTRNISKCLFHHL